MTEQRNGAKHSTPSLNLEEALERLSITVATPMVAQAAEVLDWAYSVPDIVVFAAPPGCGKTWAAEHWSAGRDRAWIVDGGRATPKANATLSEIARALGFFNIDNRTNNLRWDIDAWFERRGGVLIFDEAHQLSVEALEEIRGLFDKNACRGLGIALIGDLTLPNKLAPHPQLQSRIAMQRIIAGPSDEDVKAILASLGIDDARSWAFLKRVADGKHGLRGLAKCCRIVFALSVAEEKPVTFELVARAWKQLTGGQIDE